MYTRLIMKEKLIRCYGCAFFTDLTGIGGVFLCNIDKAVNIEDIEDCHEFTCPKHCQCIAQPHEPLPCEIIPEELAQLI